MREIKLSVEEVRRIIKVAEDCRCHHVAIILARKIGDHNTINKNADGIVNRIKWHIPVAERTDARLQREKEEILQKIV